MIQSNEAFHPPMAFTTDFFSHIQTWDVVIVWDKDHTMVDPYNIIRPNLEAALLNIYHRYPTWKHVILTENSHESVSDMFEKCPSIRPIFEMILCDDNYFSRKVIRKYFKQKGFWWISGRRIRKERVRRKKRLVDEIFLGKKVVLIDDLRDGRIPEHSFCVFCKVWTGESTLQQDLDWPMTLRDSVLRVLRNLYHYKEPSLRSDSKPPTHAPDD